MEEGTYSGLKVTPVKSLASTIDTSGVATLLGRVEGEISGGEGGVRSRDVEPDGAAGSTSSVVITGLVVLASVVGAEPETTMSMELECNGVGVKRAMCRFGCSSDRLRNCC